MEPWTSAGRRARIVLWLGRRPSRAARAALLAIDLAQRMHEREEADKALIGDGVRLPQVWERGQHAAVVREPLAQPGAELTPQALGRKDEPRAALRLRARQHRAVSHHLRDLVPAQAVHQAGEAVAQGADAALLQPGQLDLAQRAVRRQSVATLPAAADALADALADLLRLGPAQLCLRQSKAVVCEVAGVALSVLLLLLIQEEGRSKLGFAHTRIRRYTHAAQSTSS